ncbi:Uncharacterized protein HZ326_11054 [Fusarium oxysporum f. sp. albedinis]|nr:Uncharacterized protein HZ326_11054 [Fusarium oxysporum f. sp. albedinis]
MVELVWLSPVRMGYRKTVITCPTPLVGAAIAAYRYPKWQFMAARKSVSFVLCSTTLCHASRISLSLIPEYPSISRC